MITVFLKTIHLNYNAHCIYKKIYVVVIVFTVILKTYVVVTMLTVILKPYVIVTKLTVFLKTIRPPYCTICIYQNYTSSLLRNLYFSKLRANRWYL